MAIPRSEPVSAERAPGEAAEADGPEWPDEAVESGMIAEQRDREPEWAVPVPAPAAAAAPPAKPAEEAPAGPLPKLDEIIQKIPPQVRETLDELFRARFTAVQRVPAAALKVTGAGSP